MLVGRQEEKRLFLVYRRTGDRRDRDVLVEHFLPLAFSLARRYRRGPEPLEDLQQVASLALVKAVEAFDPSRETAFSSFAVPSIAGALKRHFRDNGWSVRVPRDLKELAMRVARVSEDLQTETGTSPTPAQVAQRAGLSVEQVLEAREAYHAQRSESLEQPRASSEEGAGGSLLDTLGARDAAIQRAFDHVALEALLETLDDRDRAIVSLYYQHELTQSEIGRRLGYSQMHVSRLLRQAVERLLLNAAATQEDVDRRIQLTAT